VKTRDDRGSALVEFSYLSLLLLVLMIYAMSAAFVVQRSAFALTAASREAGRVFVQADSGAQALSNARLASGVVLRDQGVNPARVRTRFTCAAKPCLSPGARVDVTLSTSVPVPFVPAFMKGLSSIPMSAKQSVVVDVYRQERP